MRMVALLPLVLAAAPAGAQEGAPPAVVQFYSYNLIDKAAFETGYRKHLEWHARAGDKLSWFAWEVATGERMGLFIDGTVASLEDLDARPDLAGDGADFVKNAASHATFRGVETWGYWRGASTAPFPLSPSAGTMADVFLIEVAPSAASGFETAIERLAAGPRNSSIPLTWLKLMRGGGAPSYMVITSRSNWSGIGAAGATFPDILRRAYSADAVQPAMEKITAIRSETWTYLPKLSLAPGQPLSPP